MLYYISIYPGFLQLCSAKAAAKLDMNKMEIIRSSILRRKWPLLWSVKMRSHIYRQDKLSTTGFGNGRPGSKICFTSFAAGPLDVV